MSTRWKSTLERLPNIVKYLMVLGVVVFISFLFPNNVKFKYNYESGQTWRYEDLKAPFDFAIRKTEDELVAEREALTRDFSPYYKLDQEIVKAKKKIFREEFNTQLELARQGEQYVDVIRNPDKYLSFGEEYLENLYSRGLVDLREEHKEKGGDFVINIVNGSKIRKETIENVLSPTDAKELLTDSLPYSKLAEPDFPYLLLENLIEANTFYSDTLNAKFKADLLSSISPSRGMVMKGESIVLNNGIVTEEIYQKLESFRMDYEQQITLKKSSLWVFIGYFLLTSLIVGVFLLYLRTFAQDVFKRFNKLLFVLFWLVVYSYLVFVVEQTNTLSAYIIPFCIVPIVIKNFYDARLALFTHIVVVLIASFLSSLGYEFTFLQILAGIVVLLSNVDTRDWNQFFYSMLYIFLAYALAWTGLSLIQEGTWETIDLSVYPWIFLNVLFTLLAYPLIPLLERFFGFTSSISLMELSDMNRPLLRELALKAPGTLQHSLQVANLAEAAAQRIGANPLLVKVAALYHDIGKTAKPEYYIENQSGKNPHNDISDLESAKIIIEHVTEGLQMAKKFRLPTVITDFIKTHHGTTRVEYFYRNHLKAFPEHNFDESLFRYPGPRPSSKEETILMLADSIEAACKSLKDPTEASLTELIDKVVAGKITQGQLLDSEMTFKELEECVQVFKQILKSVHHVRIEYPEEQVAKNSSK